MLNTLNVNNKKYVYDYIIDALKYNDKNIFLKTIDNITKKSNNELIVDEAANYILNNFDELLIELMTIMLLVALRNLM